MLGASARTSRVFPMAFLMFAVLVVSAPAAAADQEATWVRTTPGVWMLEDSDGLLHEPQPQPGLFLSPVEG
ncbi:MAG: hypothetical protein VYA52_03770, partial [Candidatus Thermoplasmatota archaeon]|nr:hypothetical protein [Candidatus Thermoplasmatota archaeon]